MASLKIGIVGLPNVGKSTLFNALSGNRVLAANYPFATIEPNTGIVAVPDQRLAQLAELFEPDKITPATVTFLDIAGLVEGAHKGEGLGNQFLAHIREVNAICHVVRGFTDPNVTHVDSVPNPSKDIETIHTELALADIQTLDRVLDRLNKEAKANPKVRSKITALEAIKNELNSGAMLSLTDAQKEALEDVNLLMAKSFVFSFNVDENTLQDEARKQELAALVAPHPTVFICAKLEAELTDLGPEASKELLAEYGQEASGLEQLIHVAYDILGLQTFLTAGKQEVRAWTIQKGAKAPEAAGTIHTDFQRGFIAADIINYQKLLEAGSWAEARKLGLVRTEGKEYVMADGDVVEFKFNV